MLFEDDAPFAQLFHGVDERIPLEAFRFGIETLYDLVSGFAGKRDMP